MGTTTSASKSMKSPSSSEIMDTDIDGNNGLILNDFFLPEEMLIQILFFVDHDSLVFNGRLVCKVWKRLIESIVLKSKVDEGPYSSLSTLDPITKHRLHLHWSVYYQICKNDLLSRNLLKNSSGEENLKHWIKSKNGGDSWKVEAEPQGVNPLPETDKDSPCFVTSYQECVKHQIITLKEHGFSQRIMDEIQPVISIRELYSARFDCGAVYHIHVVLLDENKKIIDKFEKDDIEFDRMEWHEVCHEFKNYGPGVRYIKYCHGGRDTQFWAGHYGAKIAGSTVKLLYPLPSELPEVEEDLEDLYPPNQEELKLTLQDDRKIKTDLDI